MHKISDGEVHKLVSEVLGTVVSGASGGAIAHKATEFNWLSHEDQINLANALWHARAEEEKGKIIAHYTALDAYNDEHYPIYSSNNSVESGVLEAFTAACVPNQGMGMTRALQDGLSVLGPVYASVSASLLGTVGFEMGGSVGVDNEMFMAP